MAPVIRGEIREGMPEGDRPPSGCPPMTRRECTGCRWLATCDTTRRFRAPKGIDYILRVGESTSDGRSRRMPLSIPDSGHLRARGARSGTPPTNSRRGSSGAPANAGASSGAKVDPRKVSFCSDGGRRTLFSDNYIAVHFIESIRCQRKAHLRLSALKTGLECLKLHPLDLDYYRPFFNAIAPTSVLHWITRPPE